MLKRIKNSLKVRTKNHLARFNWVRKVCGRGYAPRPNVLSELFQQANPDQIHPILDRDGVWQGFKLPNPILGELIDFAHRMPVYGNRNPQWGFHVNDLQKAQQKTGKRFAIASYFNTHRDCLAIQKIVQDPVINEVAKRYIGPRARHLGTNMWWSYAEESLGRSDRNESAQLFHYDLDDYKFIKFFFYLTDVDEDSGPHIFVRGSHRQKPRRHLYPMRRLEDLEVEQSYHKADILTLTGQAGEGFVEDTFGIHKGAAPVKKNRLLLQLYFATSLGYTDDVCPPEKLKMVEI